MRCARPKETRLILVALSAPGGETPSMPRVQLPGLKPTHKLVQAYYAALSQFDQHHVTRETAVRHPFLDLLRAAAGQRGWSLEPEFPMQGNRGNRIVVDAALRDAFWRVHGYPRIPP